MKNNLIATLVGVLVFGFVATIQAEAYSVKNNSNNLSKEASLNYNSGTKFSAGTYVDAPVEHVSVQLDGTNEAWAAHQGNNNSKGATVTIYNSAKDVWSDHYVKSSKFGNWTAGLGYKSGSYRQRF